MQSSPSYFKVAVHRSSDITLLEPQIGDFIRAIAK